MKPLHEDPRLVLLIVALISVMGIAGFITRESREDPKSKVRWGYVTTRLPGAEPREVESLVSEPIERMLREAGGVESIETSSLRGVSLVFIRLTGDVTDVSLSWSRIQDKLSQVADKLPPRAGVPILVDEQKWSAHTRVVGLYEKDGTSLPVDVLSRWGTELNNRLSFVPGTRFTEVFGLPEEEILVEIDEETIAATKLTAREIVNRIRARDSDGFDALSQSGSLTMPVSLAGDVTDLDRIRDLLVQSGRDNRQIQLGDLASIRRSEHQPRNESAYLKGRRAVIVAARMDEAEGIDRWTRLQQEALDEFEASLPAGLGLSIVFSQKTYTDQRAANLYGSLGAGMFLVIVVVCFLMGWRAAFPICAALPLTLGIVFCLMIPFGISLHQMSIAGLILALGMLIDNPIIVVDEVQRRLDRGVGVGVAYHQSILHLAKPLLGSNVTTVLGFIPILLIGGPTGEFMEQLAWSVIACLLGSLALSLTVIPVLAVWFLKANVTGDKKGERSRLPSKRLYWRLLGAGLRFPRLVILGTVAISIFGYFVAGSIDKQFFPGAERNHFHFSVRLPTHVSIEETERVALRARDITMSHQEVGEVAIFVGRSSPKLHYSMVALEDNRPNYAQALVQLTTPTVPINLLHEIQAELDELIPEAQCIVTLLEQGPPAPAPIEFRIYGQSIQELSELGQKAQTLLMDVPGIIHTHASLDPGGPLLSLHVSQTEAERSGLADEAISRQISDALDGVVLTNMSEDTEEIPIRVRLQDSNRITPERVSSLPLVTPGPIREIIPVDSLASWSVEQQIFSIYQRNAVRCNIIYAYTRAGALPIPIEDQFKKILQERGFELPIGYRSDFGGISGERDSAVRILVAPLTIIGILMISVLVLTFSSFRLAFIIVAVAVLSVGLGLSSLWLFSYPIGIVSIIGLTGLLGLAVNDSIVVLSECNTGESESRTIHESVFSATRHVLTTSVTTVAGVLPLILRGGEFFPPMMIVIAGGIVGATLIALGFTPACYVMLRRENQSVSVAKTSQT